MTVSVTIARHRGTESGNKGILRLHFPALVSMERSSERMLLRTMTQFTSPVLHSLLDTDAYKLHMQQAVFHRYGDVACSGGVSLPRRRPARHLCRRDPRAGGVHARPEAAG